MREATVEEALAHPTWQMGSKISIDSATVMNKCLEVIERGGCLLRLIKYHCRPSAVVVHAMVEMIDGSIIAQLRLRTSAMIHYA